MEMSRHRQIISTIGATQSNSTGIALWCCRPLGSHVMHGADNCSLYRGVHSMTGKGRAIQGSLLPPFRRGDGGLRYGCLRKIPPFPPLSKGGTDPIHRKLHDPEAKRISLATGHPAWLES